MNVHTFQGVHFLFLRSLPNSLLSLVVVILHKQDYADDGNHEFENYYKKVGHNKMV